MRVALRSVRISLGDRTILDGADAEFDSAESVAVMGPSGSGKTTILGAIAGYVPLQGGEVVHAQRTSDDRPEWIVQSSPLLTRRTAVANVALGPLSRGWTSSAAATQAKNAMAALSIEDLADREVRRLSGGERQRVAVARAMASKSSIVLADEPTASLDAVSRDKVTAALVSASAHGALVIIATHDPQVARACGRILRVADGRLVQSDE